MKEQTPYWITLAHLPKWGTEKINRLVVKIVHDNKMSLEDFFMLSTTDWKEKFELSENDILLLEKEKEKLPNNAFLAEELLSQGFDIIPINSVEYSQTLKKNLKIKAPTILYIKGNKRILQEDSIAIVGSRKANEIALQFTDNVAKKATENFKIVVSGFAKGVDKQALDSAINYKGQSIIVLPQGIMTFGSGIKKYYKQITNGDVLVVSTFPPKMTWSVGLAMARNPIIYALANTIFVAQSENKGGTWSGVLDGLSKGRIIFVRKPNQEEQTANLILIEKGAKMVDIEGNIVETIASNLNQEKENLVVDLSKEEVNKIKIENIKEKVEEIEIKSQKNEVKPKEKQESEIEMKIDKVINLLEQKPITPRQIIEKIDLEISQAELTKKLKKIPNIQTTKQSNRIHYFLSENEQKLNLFK